MAILKSISYKFNATLSIFLINMLIHVVVVFSYADLAEQNVTLETNGTKDDNQKEYVLGYGSKNDKWSWMKILLEYVWKPFTFFLAIYSALKLYNGFNNYDGGNFKSSDCESESPSSGAIDILL